MPKRYIYWDDRWPVFFLDEEKPQTIFSSLTSIEFTEEELAELSKITEAYYDWQEKLEARSGKE